MTWIPFTNDRRWQHPPLWVLDLDSGMGRVMCAVGIHRRGGAGYCWYCEPPRTWQVESLGSGDWPNEDTA